MQSITDQILDALDNAVDNGYNHNYNAHPYEVAREIFDRSGIVGFSEENKTHWVTASMAVGKWRRLNPEPTPPLGDTIIEVEVDMINHPSHYNNHPSGIECAEITENMGTLLGSCVKYLWRWDSKDTPLKNIGKANWYAERLRNRGLHAIYKIDPLLIKAIVTPYPEFIAKPLEAALNLSGKERGGHFYDHFEKQHDVLIGTLKLAIDHLEKLEKTEK